MNATTISAYIAKLENENKLLREEVHELNDDAADYRIEIFRLKAVIEDLEEELDEDYESDEESVVSTEDEESDEREDPTRSPTTRMTSTSLGTPRSSMPCGNCPTLRRMISRARRIGRRLRLSTTSPTPSWMVSLSPRGRPRSLASARASPRRLMSFSRLG